MGILLGLQDSETNTDIREYAIKALHDSLNFMEKHLIKKVKTKYNFIKLKRKSEIML